MEHSEKIINELELLKKELNLLNLKELESVKNKFDLLSSKIIKDLRRQGKILIRSDKRQKCEYDDLLEKYEEIGSLNKEIEDTQKEVVFTMGSIAETRSKETGNHVKRVAEYSKLLALYYGLTKDEAEILKQASPMHDIGKVAIPDNILNKPGAFTSEERVIMNTHSELGYKMLSHSKRKILKTAAIVAYEHHENGMVVDILEV